MLVFFQYGQTETDYLKSKDKVLGAAIDKIGHINRPVNQDIFSSLIFTIIGQQISSAAQKTIGERLETKCGKITPASICGLSIDDIKQCGTSFRKAGYIKEVSEKVQSGELKIKELKSKTDDEVIAELTKLKGIGPWTAEMLMLFSLQRPDILSFNDLAIHRGLCTLYHKEKIDKT